VVSDRPGRPLPERQATVRAELKQVLHEAAFTCRDLSARVGISEKDVAGHLEHLARSVRASGERLEVEPARCLGCGYTFTDRTRFSKPSRCPRCKAERIAAARYRISRAR
jgi:transcriptional regulator